MSKKMYVYTQFVKEGYHLYPEAKDHPSLATGDYLDVSHLGERHFHYFYFKVWVEVNHSNRDIEFIQLRRRIEREYREGAMEVNHKSCEMLAEDLLEVLKTWYPGVSIKIDVSEENINGALLEYTP